MPRDLVLVRHGQSEANVIQAARKHDPEALTPDGFHDRHDWQMRLSARGAAQAEAAGIWLRQEFPEGFDRAYASSLIRTRETASRLGILATWHLDDRWREREWGEVGVLNNAERAAQYPLSMQLREQSKWYWHPAGGESLATDVRLRFTTILDTLHREMDGQRVLAVTHGQMIDVARFVLERLLPEEWEAQDHDRQRQIPNCAIVHYSRVNPETQEVGPRMAWRRVICPWDESQSWNGGAWEHFEAKRTFTNAELLEQVEAYPRLLPTPDETA